MMGFYHNKLKTYSKYIKFNKSLMEVTQRKIIESREKNLNKLKEDYRVSCKYHIEDMNPTVENDIIIGEKEIDFLKTLGTVDFYQHLINVENYNLFEILKDASANRREYAGIVERSSEKKYTKNSPKIMAGLHNRRIEKNTRLMNEEDLKIGLAAESMAEWSSLTPDDHIIYLVGRFELEGKDSFDKESFNQYKDTVYRVKHIKDTPTKTQNNPPEKQ